MATVLVALATGLSCASAMADGDPASDVLAQQALFLPQDARVPSGQQAQLAALLAEAARSGVGMRVAVIGSASDLGSVGELWGQPRSYARFLGQELALLYRGLLLVVMPAGVGVSQVGAPLAAPLPAERAAVAPLGVAARGAGLGQLAVTAIRRLAAAAGHALPLPRPRPQRAPTRAASSWIVFAAGAILILAAWTASLRARPPRLRRRDAATS